MGETEEPATRIYFEGGQFVRASESIGEVSMNMADPTLNGWIAVEDPGDGRSKLVRTDRILWIEQESEHGANLWGRDPDYPASNPRP